MKGEVELPENGVAMSVESSLEDYSVPPGTQKSDFGLTEHKFLHTYWKVGCALQLDF